MTGYPKRTKRVIATAMNLLVEVNQVMVENARKGVPTKIVLPSLFDRAFMLVRETTVMPIIDVLEERRNDPIA